MKILHIQKTLIFEVATPETASAKTPWINLDRNKKNVDFRSNKINAHDFTNHASSIINSKKIKKLLDEQTADNNSLQKFLNTNNIAFSINDDDMSINIGSKNNLSTEPTANNTSKLTIKYADNSVEEIVSTLESENRIRVRQYSVDNNKNILDIVFRLDKINGWIFDINEDIEIQGLDPKATLVDFNFFGFVLSFVLRKNVRNSLNEQKRSTQLQNNTDKSAAPCLNHDLKCSGPGSKFSSVILSNICVESFQVDLSSCCIAHDIAYYCTPSNIVTYLPSKMTSDIELAACAFAKILAAYIEHAPPWYCGGIITAVAAGLVAGAWGSLLMYAVVTFMGWPKTPDGFEDSCLCLGTKQTVWCDDHCVNMCEKMGKETGCFKCQWKCIYDQGKVIDVQHFSNPQKPCCLTTEEGSPCLGSKKDALKKCPTCFHCRWICTNNKGRLQRVFVQDKDNNLPCCPGTNSHEIKLRPDWCPDRKKSVGFI